MPAASVADTARAGSGAYYRGSRLPQRGGFARRRTRSGRSRLRRRRLAAGRTLSAHSKRQPDQRPQITPACSTPTTCKARNNRTMPGANPNPTKLDGPGGIDPPSWYNAHCAGQQVARIALGRCGNVVVAIVLIVKTPAWIPHRPRTMRATLAK